MSLCFLDGKHSPEAVCFKTSNEDCWIRLNAATATATGALWGIHGAGQYLGFTTGERPLQIEPNAVRIPDHTAFTIGDKDSPILNIQPAPSTVSIQATDVQIHAPVTVRLPKSSSSQGFYIDTCFQANRSNITLSPSNQISLTAPTIALGDSLRLTSNALTVTSPTKFHQTVTTSNVHIHQSLTLPPNSRIEADQASIASMRISQHLTLEPTTVLQASGKTTLISDALTFQMDAGRLWIGATTSNVSIPVQIDTHVAARALTTGALAVNGSATVDGVLTLAHPSVTHTIQGSLALSGKTLTVTQATPEFQKGLVVHQSCTIGQTHKPAEVIVYGTTHLSKGFYSHDYAYFDKTTRMNADLLFAPNAVDAPRQPVIAIPKGSIALSNGHLWVNASTAQCDSSLTFLANGNSAIQGQLTVSNGLMVNQSVTHAGPGATDIRPPLFCRSNVSLDSTLTVAGATELKGSLKCHQDLLLQPGARLTLTNGDLTVNGDIQATTLRSTGQTFVGGVLDVPNGPTRLRNRRYAVYEPFFASQERWIRFITLPFNRGFTHFYIKLQGHFFTPKQTKSFTIELGGTIASPTVKHCTVNGALGANIDPFANITFYQHPTTRDLTGYIELQRHLEIGIEIDIEIGAENDCYEWQTTTAPPTASGWTLWWKPLMTPDASIQGDATCLMHKLGIGEKQPLYMLDVRPDARFQSNIYQPFPADLLQALGLTPTLHQGKSYAALTDILACLVRRTLPNV